MLDSEKNKVLAMGDKLRERVVGQDEAIQVVTQAIQRSRAGLNDPSKPIASLIFLGPTGVGEGVAIPHARVEGLDKVVGVFYRMEKPIDYDSVDRHQVDLIFALFAPIDSGVDHLKALALVSRSLRDPSVRAKLRSNQDETALFAILTEIATPKAA